jgi:hypothetical protein
MRQSYDLPYTLIMNPYVQYIETRGNLAAIKDLSSMWGVFSQSLISFTSLFLSPAPSCLSLVSTADAQTLTTLQAGRLAHPRP